MGKNNELKRFLCLLRLICLVMVVLLGPAPASAGIKYPAIKSSARVFHKTSGAFFPEIVDSEVRKPVFSLIVYLVSSTKLACKQLARGRNNARSPLDTNCLHSRGIVGVS